MISIIIPTYNEEEMIGENIRHIKDLMCGIDYEIIVVDNGSVDKTREIVRDLKCKLIVHPLITIGGLRNLGCEISEGNILVFLDADVLITKEWVRNINRVVKMLLESEKVIVTGSRCGISNNPSWIEKYWFLPMIFEESNYINSGHMIVTKKNFIQIGRFDEGLNSGEDYEFCYRVRNNKGLLINDSSLLVIHEGYPKTFFKFMFREVCHGRDDFKNISTFFKSKVAILSFIYCIILMFGILLALYYQSFLIIIASLIINFAMSVCATLVKMRKYSLNFPIYCFLYNAYFISRGLSLICRIFLSKESLLQLKMHR